MNSRRRAAFLQVISMIGMNAATGKYIAGNDHLRQSVHDILMTPIGSRVLLREYGSEIRSLIDNPQDDSLRVRIVQASASAISRWEPRITLKKITVSFVAEGQFWLTLAGINNETGESLRLEEIKIGNSSGND